MPKEEESLINEKKMGQGISEIKLTRAPASELPAEQLKLKESYTAALEDMETKFLKPGFDKLKFLLEKRNLAVNRETIAPYLESIESTIGQRLQTFCEIKEKQGVKLDYFGLVPAAMETLMGWVKDEEMSTQNREMSTLKKEMQALQEKSSAQQEENKKLKEELDAARAELAELKQKTVASTSTAQIKTQEKSSEQPTEAEEQITTKIASLRKELEAKLQEKDEKDFMRFGQKVYRFIRETKEKSSPQEKACKQLDYFWSEVKGKFKEKGIGVIDEVDRPYDVNKHLPFGDKKGKKVTEIAEVGYQYLNWRDPESRVVEKAQVYLKD